MKNIISKLQFILVRSAFGIALLISFNSEAVTLPQSEVADQMVCHAGKILTVLNKNYSKKSLTCVKRSTQSTYDYNNLAEIYAEGWIVIDINNANTWVFNK
jgi:hypothetical protein